MLVNFDMDANLIYYFGPNLAAAECDSELLSVIKSIREATKMQMKFQI